ncbi:MAG: hypothetical protein JO359_14205 [Candidatus Eremiobacteraeota bacterium]|nr:hypothetical protein [Candidatus Eremiobacteraeota bacterium]
MRPGSSPPTPPREAPRAFVLGGNASTLAFTSSFRPEGRQLTVWLVPLAWTPIGVVQGEAWQKVNIAADNIAGWTDETFSPDDGHAFVTSLRDAELLTRTEWTSEPPSELRESIILNPEDVPEDVLDALSQPAEPLVTCQVCRRTCVRDHFVWNERQLCAWDFHALVFGRRGPWRNEPYEERLWETIPRPAYVAPMLLEEQNVDLVLALGGVDESVARHLIDELMRGAAGGAYLAVRSEAGLSLLRERPAPS